MEGGGPSHTVTLALSNLALTGTSSCLSILGAVLIFITYFKIPESKNFTRRLLVYLTIADFLTAVGNLVATVRYAIVHGDDVRNSGTVTELCNANNSNYSAVDMDNVDNVDHVDMETICEAQSFVTTFSNLSSFIWTFIIAIHIWSSAIFKTNSTEVSSLHLLYHFAGWIIPIALVTVVLQKGYLGEDYCFGTGVWCGIRSDLDPATIEMWMYIVDIGWQLTCYVSTCFLYMHLKYYIKLNYSRVGLRTISANLRNEDNNFIFVWMIIYLLKFWGLLRFFIATYTPIHELASNPHLIGFMDFLLLMQSFGASGQAFCNCVLFCFLDKTVRRRMKSWIWEEEEERRELLGSVD